jgi:hypothetical protein
MRFYEIATAAERQRIDNLDRTAKQAAYRVKQERYQQGMKRYNEKMRTRKAGSKPPKRPKLPKPPQFF